MKSSNLTKPLAVAASMLLLASAGVLGTASAANADVPDPPMTEAFSAILCEGTTSNEDPRVNEPGNAISDTTLVFGERLQSYNEGRVVPLYDAWGTTILMMSDPDNEAGIVRDGQVAAYPPICGTRYEESVGEAVSEWMYCTDRLSQTCADTDGLGRLVDSNGELISPMEHLDGNPKLADDPQRKAERLISYLIHNGHPYEGIGSQSFGGATEARSDLGTDERYALQTLVWCISDPGVIDDDSSDGLKDFVATCELVLPQAEQERLLALTPLEPELVLSLSTAPTEVKVGDTAKFTINTNVYNQPINLTLGGTASPAWSVCEGPATLSDSTLTVTGTDATISSTIVLCATATVTGTAQIDASASPASREHIGWSQGTNAALNPDADPCQVYATFHKASQLVMSDSASAEFSAATTTKTSGLEIANTGATAPTPLIALGVIAVLAGGVLIAVRRLRAHTEQ